VSNLQREVWLVQKTPKLIACAECPSTGKSWASAHRGNWGQLTPGKMGEKLKSENMQKRAVFYVYVIF